MESLSHISIDEIRSIINVILGNNYNPLKIHLFLIISKWLEDNAYLKNLGFF